MHIVPRKIPRSKQPLSDQLTVSVLVDRTLTVEIGKGVLVILSTEEAAALRDYLQRHTAKFQRIGGQS